MITKAKPIPQTHPDRYVSDFRTFVRAAGIIYLNESGLNILDAEAKEWERTHQRPREQAGEIHIPALIDWGKFVSESTMGLTGRLFAWYFRESVAAGLRRGDLLNTDPATTVLSEGGLVGFSVKTKTWGKSE